MAFIGLGREKDFNPARTQRLQGQGFIAKALEAPSGSKTAPFLAEKSRPKESEHPTTKGQACINMIAFELWPKPGYHRKEPTYWTIKKIRFYATVSRIFRIFTKMKDPICFGKPGKCGSIYSVAHSSQRNFPICFYRRL